MKPPPSCEWRSLAKAPLAVVLLLMLGACGNRNTRTQSASSLPEPDRAMLGRYEAVRAALAQDDFRGVKRLTAGFLKEFDAANPSGAKPLDATYLTSISNAPGIEPQREAFRAWSKVAIEHTNGVEGFYVIHCPLPGCGDWLQKDAEVDNPFMGKSMHDCGVVQK